MLVLRARIIFKSMKKPRILLETDKEDTMGGFDQYQYKKFKLKEKKVAPKPVITPIEGQKDISYHIKTLEKILKFRGINKAPVDTMGCDQLYDDTVDNLSQKFQILASIMLSVQTKDQTTSYVVRDMAKDGVLDPHVMSKMTQQDVESRIRKVNYHKTKAKNLIKAAKSVVQNGLPRTYQQVTSLSGVGVKVGTLYIKLAEGVNQGIGTDTHVHRISNRLGWIFTKTPEKTEYKLRQTFPSEYWRCMNHALVGFGQTICQAKKPKCSKCPVADRCPSSQIEPVIGQLV